MYTVLMITTDSPTMCIRHTLYVIAVQYFCMVLLYIAIYGIAVKFKI